MKKKLVVLTGAGISAESGIRTFRDMGGLWEEHDVMEVASPEGGIKILSWYFASIMIDASNSIPLSPIAGTLLWLRPKRSLTFILLPKTWIICMSAGEVQKFFICTES